MRQRDVAYSRSRRPPTSVLDCYQAMRLACAATTRWTVSVSCDTDMSVRSFLAERGVKKGDLSKFIEGAIPWCVLDQIMAEAHAGYGDELQDLLGKAVAANAHRLIGAAHGRHQHPDQRPTGADVAAGSAAGALAAEPLCAAHRGRATQGAAPSDTLPEDPRAVDAGVGGPGQRAARPRQMHAGSGVWF